MTNPSNTGENKAAPQGEQKAGPLGSGGNTTNISSADVKNPNATAVDGGQAKGAAARQESK